MALHSLWALSVANLRQRRLRTLVGAISVALACALLTIALSAAERVRTAVAGFDERNLLIRSGRSDDLPFALVGQLKSALGSEIDVEWLLGAGIDKPEQHLKLAGFAVSDDYFSAFPSSVLAVSSDARARWLSDRQGVLVTEDAARRTGWKVGDTITLQTGVGAIEAHVSGLTGGAVSLAVILHYDLVDGRAQKRGNVSIVTVRHVADADAAIATINQRFASSDPPLLVMRERAFHQHIMAVSGILPALLGKSALVFAVCVFFVIMSNSFVSFRERAVELGALRAIGFTRARLLRMLVGESIVSCGGAALIGCGLPYLLYREHGLRLGGLALENVTMSGEVCLQIFGLTVVLGTIAMLLPALLVVRNGVLQLLEPR